MKRKHIRFAKDTVYSLLGFGVLIISNFLFNFFAARQLGAEKFGIFNSFFYFLLGLAQPLNAFQLSSAKYFSKINDYTFPHKMLKVFFGGYVIIVMLFAVLYYPLKSFYHLNNFYEVIAGGLIVAGWFVMDGFRGYYQGNMNFKVYGFNIGLEGLLRALIGILLLYAGLSIKGALFSSVFSGILAISVLLIPLIAYIKHDEHSQNSSISFLMKEFLISTLVLLPFGILINHDVIMVQHMIGGKASGFLGTAVLFGKNMIVLSLIIANVVYSYSLKFTNNSKIFEIGLAVITVLFVGVAVVIWPLSEYLINFLFGKEYSPAASILPLYIVAMLPFGILQQFVNYMIAKEVKFRSVIIWFLLGLAFVFDYVVLKQTSNLKKYILYSLVYFTMIDIVVYFYIGKFGVKINSSEER